MFGGAAKHLGGLWRTRCMADSFGRQSSLDGIRANFALLSACKAFRKIPFLLSMSLFEDISRFFHMTVLIDMAAIRGKIDKL